MGKIDFETRHYADESLNRFEANDFVEAVVASAFPVTHQILWKRGFRKHWY